jgi:hypothetical protein
LNEGNEGNMSKDQTEKVEDIYCSALEIESPDERKVFLDHACRGDAGLRLEVDKWLARQPAVDKFFQEIDVAGLLAEALLDLPPQLPAKAAPGNAGGAGADQVSGQSVSSFDVAQPVPAAG